MIAIRLSCRVHDGRKRISMMRISEASFLL
jgi:hypothetical protein